jgi:8-oxo-dGTP diphosphatase
MKKKYQYDYPRPALTADVLLTTVKNEQLQVLLIQRKHPPFKKRWALPGGFVNEGESILDAALRELNEETGIVVKYLEPFGSYGDPGRDPRGWTVTVAYAGLVRCDDMNPQAADDAASLDWFSIDDLPRLAFDHDRIIADGLNFLRQQLPAHNLRASEAKVVRKLLREYSPG